MFKLIFFSYSKIVSHMELEKWESVKTISEERRGSTFSIFKLSS